MTKSELIKQLKIKHPELAEKYLDKLVDVIFDELSKALGDGKRIELRGFGAFSVRKRKARQARNPKTSEVIHIAERNTIYFRCGKEVRELLNDNSKQHQLAETTAA